MYPHDGKAWRYLPVVPGSMRTGKCYSTPGGRRDPNRPGDDRRLGPQGQRDSEVEQRGPSGVCSPTEALWMFANWRRNAVTPPSR